jgi:hypothetical protein
LPLADEHVAEEKAPRTGYAHDNQEGGCARTAPVPERVPLRIGIIQLWLRILIW